MTDKLKHILVIDDEELICQLMQCNLELEGFKVDCCYSAEEALSLDLSRYALLVLDIMMGEMSGIKLAHHIKQNPATAHIPIIFCSAKGCESDIVDGFNSGADDYIVKPFSMRQLIARVNAVLRRERMRTSPVHESDVVACGGLYIDKEARSVSIDGTPIALTRTEFDLLSLFLGEINRFFPREEIFKCVWPEQVVVSERTIDVSISRLRKKLGEYSACIVNRSGFGYGFIDKKNQ